MRRKITENEKFGLRGVLRAFDRSRTVDYFPRDSFLRIASWCKTFLPEADLSVDVKANFVAFTSQTLGRIYCSPGGLWCTDDDLHHRTLGPDEWWVIALNTYLLFYKLSYLEDMEQGVIEEKRRSESRIERERRQEELVEASLA